MSINIKVRTLDSNELQLTVQKDMLIKDLKQLIFSRSSIPVQRQRLIFQGRVLVDEKNITEYKIDEGHVLHMVAMPEQPQQSQQSSQSTTSSTSQSQQSQQSQQQPNQGPFGGMMMGPFSFNNPNGGSPDINSMISSVMQGLGFSGNSSGGSGGLPAFNFSGSSSGTGTTGQNRTVPQTSSSQTNTNQSSNTTTSNAPTQQTQQTQQTNLPNANLTIHLHVQMNELDQLPQQLNRLRSMVNLTSVHQTGSQENVQIVTETPNSTSQNNAPISQQTIMNTIRSTVQNNPNQSLTSVVDQISTSLGIDDTNENSILDQFIKTAMDCLDMSDILQLTGGNWTVFEKTKLPLRKFLVETLLENNKSTENQNKLIESSMKNLKESLVSHQEAQDFLKAQMNSSIDLVEEMIQVSRFHLDSFFDLLLNHETSFPSKLQEIFTLFIGDIISTLAKNLKNGETDAKKYLQISLEKYFQTMDSERFSMPPQFGSTIVIGYIMNRYQSYKTRFANRVPQKKNKVISKEEESLDSLLDDSLLDLDDSEWSSLDKKETTETKPKETISQPKPKPDEKWKNGLSKEEIEEIESTIKKDELEIDLDDEFSEAYQVGSLDAKNNNTSKGTKKEKVGTSRTGTIDKEDQEDVE
eukprot:gene11940-5341_t